MSLLENFRERKIVQWSVAYLAGAWLVTQLVDVLGTRWGITQATARVIDLVLVFGCLVTVVIAWYHGEKGRQKVRGIELLVIGALLALGGFGLSAIDVESIDAGADAAAKKPALLQQGEIESAPWIAVTKFGIVGDEPELSVFSSGLAAEITSGLSRYSHLLVLSRATTESVATTTADTRKIGEQLGARFVIEGEMRKSGSNLRVSARLVDALDGTTVWTQRFDRDLDEADVFLVQDDLTDRVVASIADVNGAVTRALAKSVEDKTPLEMSPYEAILQFTLNRQSVGETDHLRSRIALERAVELRPSYADAWACLAHIYLEEYISAYNSQPLPLDRALAAAHKAIDLNSTSSLAWYALAITQYFRKDLGAFRAARDRAIELNSRDTQTLAMLGILTSYSGDWEKGVRLTERAMTLNPDHPGWYRFSSFFNEYRQHEYEAALAIALRINTPQYWGDGLARTLAFAQLGNQTAARAAATDILAVWPDFETEYPGMGLEGWLYEQPGLIAHIIDGLEKAGLDMVEPYDPLETATVP